MNADVNNQHPCQCELCVPNWHLGQGDDFEPQPAEQSRQVKLEEVRAHKVRQQEHLVAQLVS